MANAPWVKLALQLNGAGGATPISLSAPLPSQGGPLWIHLDYTVDEAYEWLQNRPDVPVSVLEALFATDTRPRAADVGGGAGEGAGPHIERVRASIEAACGRIAAGTATYEQVTKEALRRLQARQQLWSGS